ncbi:tetratricopeptide repeat-containing sulfotransferase family protein [Oleiagrimonas sp. C23AA]|uniref:tetratricopeptide repeat-containing sulfotransferase family protein n=1 Tax=Oleiagrimonas sp. C23AA TaxID=2719047 RepID=UPI00142061CC|nr:tetratricopeptide repeat-containing sulfotransferase family protein [Oleiagrimonas sp. C23AA]NII11961.1 tetratricopeptide repeat protein [Oleiagrimonas sp. C23AA]
MADASDLSLLVQALQRGDTGAVITRGQALLQAEPDNDQARLLLAIALQQKGDADTALEYYAELARRHPNDSVHQGNYATALRQAGDAQAAEAHYRLAVALDEGNAAQWANLGDLLVERQAYVEGRDALLRALSLGDDSPATVIHAARACSLCRDYRAEQLIAGWREWPLDDPELIFELADLHVTLGDAHAAAELLEGLRATHPDELKVSLLLASVHERMNHREQASDLLDEIKRTYPELDPVAANEWAHQRATLALRARDVDTARQRLQALQPRHEFDYGHYFTLAEACDKSDDRAGAMAALEKAHALQMGEFRLAVPHRFEPEAPVLPAAVARVSRAQMMAWPRLTSPTAAESPVFIVGFPRSGTTLLEQMLDAHPHFQSMDERPFFNALADLLADHGLKVPEEMARLQQADCDELRRAYADMVAGKISRRPDKQLVDKNPLNMLWLPLICRLFPDARFILALRHPCDVLLSNYMQNFRSAVLAMACADMAQLARAYVQAFECWQHHVQVFMPQVFVSRYEELVADPVHQTRRLAAFLGLDDAGPMLDFDRHARDKGYIATPSYAQVIEPVNTRGMNRWHRYREALAPALPILQPLLDYWGYSAD